MKEKFSYEVRKYYSYNETKIREVNQYDGIYFTILPYVIKNLSWL